MIRVLLAVYGLGLSRAFGGEDGVAARFARLRDLLGILPGLPALVPVWQAIRGGGRSPLLVLGVAVAATAVAWGAASVVAGTVALLASPVGAQVVPGDLFAGGDQETRTLLGFLRGIAGGFGGALTEILQVFNGAVLAYAGILVVWRVVEAAVETARSGRAGVGGWDAIRIVGAVALLWPSPASGLGAGQHLVIGIGDVGGRAASLVWEPFAVSTLADGEFGAPGSLPPAYRPALGRNVLNEVCYLVMNTEAGSDPVLGKFHSSGGAFYRIGYDGIKRHVRRLRSYPVRACGEVTVEDSGDPGAARVAGAHWNALVAVQREIGGLARELAGIHLPGSVSYGGEVPDFAARAASISGAYESLALQGIAAAASANGAARRAEIEAAIRAGGWLTAGTYFHSIFASNFAVLGAASGPVAQGPSADLASWSRVAAAAVADTENRLSETELSLRPPDLTAAVSGSGSLTNRIFGFLDVRAFRIGSSGAPPADLASLGQTMINSAFGAMSALAAKAAGSGFLKSVPLFGSGLDKFSDTWQVVGGLVTSLIGVVFVAGAVLAFLLPAIPFIRFLFGVLSWVLDIVEAVIAVPL